MKEECAFYLLRDFFHIHDFVSLMTISPVQTISPEEQLAVTIHYLASGESMDFMDFYAKSENPTNFFSKSESDL